jgi:hypothetical protein
MPAKAGQIVIDISIGQAKMLLDLESAKGKLREFGAAGVNQFRQFGEAGVSEHRAVAAAMKTVEGNFLNNKRAADSFLMTIPGLGKAVQAAFPVIGAIAFAGVLVEIGNKVHDFFKQMSEGPEKMEGTFRKAGDALRTTDDELLVSNARLENEIAKLEGKPENQLKLAVEETALAFDKLADSIDRMLSGSYKALSETIIGEFDDIIHFMMGVHKDVDISSLIGGATGLGGMNAAIAKIKADADKTIDAIRTPPSTATPARFGVAPPPNAGIAAGLPGFHITGGGIPEPRLPIEGLVGQFKIAGTNPLEQEKEAIRKAYTEILKIQQDGYDKLKAEFDRVSKLGGIKSPEYLEALQFGQQQLQAEMKVTRDTIANASLVEKKGGAQEDSEKRKTAAAQAKKDQEELNRISREYWAAQDAGLSVLKKIEGQRQEELDKLKERTDLSAGAKATAAQGINATFDLRYMNAWTEAMDKAELGIYALYDETGRLKDVTSRHEQALRKDNEAVKEGIKSLDEYKGALGKAFVELGKLNEAQGKLKAEHQSRMTSMAPGAAADPLGTLRLQQAPERAAIEEQYKAAIGLANQALALAQQDNNQQAVLLATLEKQRIEAERKLAVDRLDDELAEKQAETRQKGVKDFFREMQGQAQTAGNIFYDAMTSGLDRVSDQLAKLLTGQKTNFGKMLQGLGEEMVKESTKSLMHQGLGKLGDLIFGKKKDVEAHKPTGNPGDAVHVLVDNQPGAPGAPVSAGNFQNLAGLVGAGSSGLAGLLKGLFSAGGAGASSGLTEAVSSSITFMAGGGDVDPGGAYVVGEHEPEFFSPRTAGTITPASKIGGSSTTINHIDARGADLGAANRISRALEATHQSAVATAVRANAQRSWRVPQRAKA